MKIYFRKTFKYDPCHSGLSKYESYEAVTRQLYSPGIVDLDFKEHFHLPTYCSSLKRCRQTAKILSTGKITVLSDLREIKFSLYSLVSREEFERYGSSLVRERFIQSFINDSLLEKREDIKKRINRVVKIIFQENNDKLIVSHSFTMKMFEACFQKNLNIFKDPNLISKVIFTQTETYPFGGGFDIRV